MGADQTAPADGCTGGRAGGVISGIVHVLKSGCRCCDCPPEYGPSTTIYNRLVRWARRGISENLFRLAWRTIHRHLDGRPTDGKAHRSAAGGKGGAEARMTHLRQCRLLNI